jgi:hypothetical protein
MSAYGNCTRGMPRWPVRCESGRAAIPDAPPGSR